jgi:hypothetical protein
LETQRYPLDTGIWHGQEIPPIPSLLLPPNNLLCMLLQGCVDPQIPGNGQTIPRSGYHAMPSPPKCDPGACKPPINYLSICCRQYCSSSIYTRPLMIGSSEFLSRVSYLCTDSHKRILVCSKIVQLMRWWSIPCHLALGINRYLDLQAIIC